MKLTRYNLKGNYAWCLNWRNGWIRIHDVMFRWNTDWTVGHTYFSLTNMKEAK
jgi:hypothetical protein